jgi:hypothetical protein
MAGPASRSGGGATVPRHSTEESEVTGWVGWIVFAGTMMAILGVLHMFEGFIALIRHTQIVFPTSGLTVQVSYTQWGWVQILAGVVVFATGLSLFTGRTWARALGVLVLVVSVLVNFAWANIFPVWSVTLLAIDFLAIYAIIAHGGELKVAREV